MKGPPVLREIGGGKPVAHCHVCFVLQNAADHLRCALRGVSIVPVHHEITLRVHFPEHPPDHIALALAVFMAYFCPDSCGNVRCSVRGIVIINIDYCFRQDFPEIFYDLFYGPALIEARDQYCCFIHALFLSYTVFSQGTGVSKHIQLVISFYQYALDRATPERSVLRGDGQRIIITKQ